MALKISIIIPAYNASATILKCLFSLHEQTIMPWEIIVVDDGSSDNTMELAKGYATVVKNMNKKGAGGARNYGASIASGEILAFTDSDCILPQAWIQRMSEAFCEEGVAAVAGGYISHEGNSFVGNFAFLELSERRKNFNKYVETAPSNNFAIKRNIFEEIGGFPEIFATASNEDLVFSFRASRKYKIRWLHNNGIKHYFQSSIKGYLAQQYKFARDTVRMYSIFPEIRNVKTHQGCLIYFETIAAFVTFILILKPWPWFSAALCVLWCMNFKLLAKVYKVLGPSSLLKSLLFIPIRDFNWVRGIIGGMIMVTFSYFEVLKCNN